MRVLGVALLGLLAVPAMVAAGPIGFATVVDVGNWQSQSAGTSDADSLVTSQVSLYAAADLSQGALRIRNAGFNTPQGAAAQAFLYDTLTFASSAFEGAFGASYNLALSVLYEGTYSTQSTFNSAGVGGRIHVYDGSTVIDSSVFESSDDLINFMFLNGPEPVCAQGVNGPDFSTFTGGSITYTVNCQVTVTAANPTVRLIMSLPSFFNGGGTWDLNMLNTATLDLGDLGGRTVYSASGVLPGTIPDVTAVPEPGTLTTLLGGILAVAVGIVRRGRL